MKLSRERTFILLVAAQVFVVLALVAFKLSVVTSGTEVLLRVQPVDPRDPIRGDYVTFRYDVSSLPSSFLQDEYVRTGDTVYVVLGDPARGASGQYYSAVAATGEKPSEGLFLKGVIESGGNLDSMMVPPTLDRLGSGIQSGTVRIRYGIEEYFIPEGKGQNFSFFQHEVGAKVAIDEQGNAVIRQLLVDGYPWP